MAVAADRAIGLGRPRPRPRPRLRAIPRPRARRRRLPFLLLSAVLVAAMVLMLTSVQALLAQGAFRLSTLGQQAEKLELESDFMRLRLARLSSPERVAAAARRSGLVTPERVEILGRR
jgi:cell division protein FtsL